MLEIIKTDSLGQLSGVIRILGHLALSDEMNPTGINRPLKKRDQEDTTNRDLCFLAL